MLTAEGFAVSLKESDLASKNDIADLKKTTDFDDKLKNINK